MIDFAFVRLTPNYMEFVDSAAQNPLGSDVGQRKMTFLSLFSQGQSPESGLNRELPPNTRLTSVLGSQPQSFARGREVAALLLWTFAIFFSLALASYAGDPLADTTPVSADSLAPTAPITGANWVGPVGQTVAHAFVTLVGVVAWVIPLEAALLGIPFVRGRKSLATPTRLAGDILLVVIGASLVQVGAPGAVLFGRHPASGLVGELFGELARSLFSTLGSFLVGFALVGLILIGRASFSFIALMRWLARIGTVSAEKTASGARSVADAWRTAREIEREKEEERRKDNEPQIRLPENGQATAFASQEGEPDSLADNSFDAEPLLESESPPIAVAVDEAEEAAPTKPKRKPRRRKDQATKPEQADDEDKIDEEAEVEAAASAVDNEDAPEAALAVTPLESVDTAPKSNPLRAPTANATKTTNANEMTIVDTHAALEKEAPAKPLAASNKTQTKAVSREPKFSLPPLDLLTPPKPEVGPLFDEDKLRRNAELLVKTLADYKITGKVEEILPGPVVTTFEVSPIAGTKVSKVAALADDLALALAKKVRIVAPIPGKNRIGFELPNEKRVPVILHDLVEDRRFQTLDVPLPVVLGRDIVGNPVYADLASMPHAIVAGATGAGKSVGLNVMLTSLLFRRTPEELRLLMIDPKVVELAPYDRIPHMLLPVVTDMKQAATALKWAVDEMERRYQLFADAGTKNIGTYNGWVKRVIAGEIKNPAPKVVRGKDQNGLPEELSVSFDDPEGEQPLPESLPMIVIVVDEFADLMMQQGKEVEAAVARLAQKARAAGMHVILATQRPSVDVITGMIKANFPTRIAYRVAQKIDSRTILDEQGAEHLLGRGDMLIKLNGTNETKRVQCPWVSEEEVQDVTNHLRAQGEPVYDENILKPRDDEGGADDDDGETDSMYDEAVRIVAESRKCSTSWIQRRLEIGYNRAARIVETMERRGLIGPPNGAKDREVLISPL
jgi:S-DNA-T family DNA segregation ATPase FtsK/SpoIIIE